MKGGGTLNERLVKIRKDLGMNQKEFAESLAIGQSTLAMIEVGKRALNDRHIKLICSIYNVNEKWLRTGEGEPYSPQTRNQEIIEFANKIMADEDESFRKRFVAALAKARPEFWGELEKIVDETLKKD